MNVPTLLPQTAEQLFHGHIITERNCWSVLKASGDSLRDYMQGQITQDIERLKPEQGIHTCLLTPQGKAISELYICQGKGDELILLTPAHVATETVARLRRFSLGFQLRIGIVDELGVFSLQGTHAAARLAGIGLPEPQDHWLACSRDGQEKLFALVMPRQSQGFWLIGSKARLEAEMSSRLSEDQSEALRIIRGLPRFGVEWDADMHPLNANLIEFDAVSFDKGCYVGQEVTSRMHWRGGIKKKLYRVQLPNMEQTAPPLLPCPVYDSAQCIGEIRSLAFDAEGQCFGIAQLPISSVNEAMGLHLENGASLHVIEPCHA